MNRVERERRLAGLGAGRTVSAAQRREHLARVGSYAPRPTVRLALPSGGSHAPKGRGAVHRKAAGLGGVVSIAWPGSRGHERCETVCLTRDGRRGASKRPVRSAGAGGAVAVRMGGRAPKLRADPAAGTLGTLVVDFSEFGRWYEIDSVYEGRFMERVARGAFKASIDSGRPVRVLFNHGRDALGALVLGVPGVLEERTRTAHLEAPLLDTSYNRDLLPGLRAGAYGSSFMFETLAETWVQDPGRSEHNPAGWPERTVTEVELHEAGPVTFPASPGATAGMRCGTDWYARQLDVADAGRLERGWRAVRSVRGAR